jgi:hypothetical protein
VIASDGALGPGTGSFFVFALVGLLGYSFLEASAKARIANWATNVAALCVFIPQGAVLWKIGLVVGGANLVGGYLGARTAVARGTRFVRVVFIGVVGAFTLKIGSTVQAWLGDRWSPSRRTAPWPNAAAAETEVSARFPCAGTSDHRGRGPAWSSGARVLDARHHCSAFVLGPDAQVQRPATTGAVRHRRRPCSRVLRGRSSRRGRGGHALLRRCPARGRRAGPRVPTRFEQASTGGVRAPAAGAATWWWTGRWRLENRCAARLGGAGVEYGAAATRAPPYRPTPGPAPRCSPSSPAEPDGGPPAPRVDADPAPPFRRTSRKMSV